jgi:hypothetical protein
VFPPPRIFASGVYCTQGKLAPLLHTHTHTKWHFHFMIPSQLSLPIPNDNWVFFLYHLALALTSSSCRDYILFVLYNLLYYLAGGSLRPLPPRRLRREQRGGLRPPPQHPEVRGCRRLRQALSRLYSSAFTHASSHMAHFLQITLLYNTNLL